jgi:hypothetical protein
MSPGKTPRRRSLGRGVVERSGVASDVASKFGAVFAAVFAAGTLTVLASAGCGSTDERPATWSFISTAILEPSCATANCHSAIAQRASVDLSDRAVGYKSLTSRHFVITRAAGPTMTDEERVVRSPVPQLMRAVGNLRMPPDMPLPEIDIQLVERWISLGATE